MFVSGQVPIDGDGRVVAPGDVTAQTRWCFESVADLVREAGGSLADVVRTTVYLSDFDDIPLVREVRDGFEWDVPPATTAIEVGKFLEPEARIEIDAIAVVAGGPPSGAKII